MLNFCYALDVSIATSVAHNSIKYMYKQSAY